MRSKSHLPSIENQYTNSIQQYMEHMAQYIEQQYVSAQQNLSAKDKKFWELLQIAREFSDSLNKTGISLSPVEGRMLATLVKSHNCKSFVEIGTLTGSSGLWILRGLLHSGCLHTFENNPNHAEKAKIVFEQYQTHFADHSKSIHVHLGDAECLLPTITNAGPFDGIFIDGNKSAYGRYLDWAEQNIRTGGLIIADNVFLSGGVWGEQDHPFSEKQISVMQSFNARLADENKFLTTFIPTSEGLSVSIKL